MSKKKRKWWQAPDDEEFETLFPNSTHQHENSWGKNKEVIIWDEEEDGRVASPYNFEWGLDKKLTDNTGTQKKSDTYQSARDDVWLGFGGGWKGYEYYKTPQLSYKYVQQMANALSAQHKIKVQIGSEWKVDLESKTLTYNPTSLIYGTKSELLATLMHEIGKLRYCQHPKQIKEKYLAMYGVPAAEALSIFEDVRADYHMLKAYESAGEIYESAIPAIDKKIGDYREMSKKLKKLIPEQIARVAQDTINRLAQEASGKEPHMADLHIKAGMKATFGIEDPDEINRRLVQISDSYLTNGTVFDYCGEMLHLMYDTDIIESHFQNIKDKVALTEQAVEPIKKKVTSQEVADLMSKDVFPHIEDLLQDFNSDNQKLQEMFPDMPDQTKQLISRMIQDVLNYLANNGRVNTGQDGNSLSRTSGSSGENVPQEWLSGDYKVLKDTVLSEIKALVSKLTFLRREEQTIRFESHQRRGKLAAKHLYKSATGNKRIFRQRLPNTNTVQSFAFSILIDTSGSMSDRNRIVHTARALVILGEVFKKMDVPFEVITFANGAKHVKKFSEVLDKTVERKIGGLVDKASGSTELWAGLELMQLKNQPEKNKVCVVLTDGGVGSAEDYDKRYFIPMKEDGILSVGFGLECEQSIEKLCLGNSKRLSDASMLPIEFANLVKSLIKRK